MEDRIIYTYKKNEYLTYKKQLILQGKKLRSISEFLNEFSISRIDEEPELYVIDLSSLAPCFKTNDNFMFQFEQLIPKFGDVCFIIEEKYSEDFLYDLRYCFDGLEALKIDVPQMNEYIKKELVLKNKVKKITDLSEKNLDTFFEKFVEQLYGHNCFKEEFREIIDTFRIFNKIGEHKILSLFLMGESGIGKTEVARVIHKCLGSKKKLAKISFGNYSSKDALNSLIGSPLGYIGSDGGELIKRIKESDIGLILIDEFEKADAPVFNYFLDVLENGKVTNTMAEEFDIDGYIIVFTSNITPEKFQKNISPELRSRFDYKGIFDLLTDEDKQNFINFRVNDIVTKYKKKTRKSLKEESVKWIYDNIDVTKYKNMRLLNQRIKECFVRCVQSESINN